jgi:hypothetical protein
VVNMTNSSVLFVMSRGNVAMGRGLTPRYFSVK